MSELFHQLGVDWRLLFSQGVNFLILLMALTFLVYKPLLKVMAERKARIESGLFDAKEADRKLRDIGKIETERVANAEISAMAIIKKAESDAMVSAKMIVASAEEKSIAILKEAAEVSTKKKIEDIGNLRRAGALLIREAIARTVELDPSVVDEKLINKALEAVTINEI